MQLMFSVLLVMEVIMHRVLIVDDACFMREIIKNIVIELGFVVCGEAENGKQALEQACELKPDIITMDITMPIMNGLESLKHMRENGVTSKIIMCSAMDQKETVMDALRNGADDFIMKPFKEETLKDIIRKLSFKQ